MEMTREDVIKIVQAMWKYKDCGYSEYKIRKALDEVLKMLEQDPITKLKRIQEIVNKPTFKAVPLDKVKKAREEIDDLSRYFDNDCCSGNRDSMFKCSEVLEILDKLIAESEVKNDK